MGVLRTRNLVGDVAEWIACKELGLTHALLSQKGYDASDALGQPRTNKGRDSRAGPRGGLESSGTESYASVVFRK